MLGPEVRLDCNSNVGETGGARGEGGGGVQKVNGLRSWYWSQIEYICYVLFFSPEQTTQVRSYLKSL